MILFLLKCMVWVVPILGSFSNLKFCSHALFRIIILIKTPVGVGSSVVQNCEQSKCNLLSMGFFWPCVCSTPHVARALGLGIVSNQFTLPNCQCIGTEFSGMTLISALWRLLAWRQVTNPHTKVWWQKWLILTVEFELVISAQ